MRLDGKTVVVRRLVGTGAVVWVGAGVGAGVAVASGTGVFWMAGCAGPQAVRAAGWLVVVRCRCVPRRSW